MNLTSGKKKTKSVSDDYLIQLWRKAVKAWHGERCVFCGNTPVECHHIIKRKHYVTRWDFKNGLPLCHYCHEIADTLMMKDKIKDFIGHEWWEYLCDMELYGKKEFLYQENLTDNEFRKKIKKELRDVVFNTQEKQFIGQAND